MKQFTLYHNPRCSKSRKALEILQNHGIHPVIIEYLKTPLSLEQITQLRAHFDLKDFIRHNEPIFKELQLTLENETQVLKAISKNPILMQRPILTCDAKAIIARPPEKVLELITRPYVIQSILNSPHFKWGGVCDGWWLQQHGKFTVILERMPPNASEKQHFHAHTDRFFYCLSGELCIQLKNKEYLLKAHEGISVPAGITHLAQNNASTDVQFLVISSPDSHSDRIDLEP